VTSVLIDANLKFIDQQRDMGKIENASKLKVKEEDRTHKGKSWTRPDDALRWW